MGVSQIVPTRRFEVWDDVGKLRTFYTKAEAERFVIDGMFIIARKALTQRERYENLLSGIGEALF